MSHFCKHSFSDKNTLRVCLLCCSYSNKVLWFWTNLSQIATEWLFYCPLSETILSFYFLDLTELARSLLLTLFKELLNTLTIIWFAVTCSVLWLFKQFNSGFYSISEYERFLVPCTTFTVPTFPILWDCTASSFESNTQFFLSLIN